MATSDTIRGVYRRSAERYSEQLQELLSKPRDNEPETESKMIALRYLIAEAERKVVILDCLAEQSPSGTTHLE